MSMFNLRGVSHEVWLQNADRRDWDERELQRHGVVLPTQLAAVRDLRRRSSVSFPLLSYSLFLGRS